ncbi:MAG: class II glutamine amidotransferase [bacterium]
MEYRGYDSAGLWVCNAMKNQTIKSIGKVSQLAHKVATEIDKKDIYHMGIAHTRWATHGGITEQNTHPHHDKDSTFTIVHNGIIENYHKIKQDLLAHGYTFYGETDTEVVANLLSYNRDGNFLSTVETTLSQLRGAYALLIVSNHAPEEMIGVKVGSPLLFGKNNNNEFFFSSDAQALVGFADQIVHLQDGEMVHIV